MMWEPIEKDNKLYGLSLNPIEKPDKNKMQGLRFAKEIIRWQKAESQRRLVEVDETEYSDIGLFGFVAWIDRLRDFIDKSDTFTADESNGKLINLKAI